MLHVDMGFFQNAMLGKKSHVDMGKSHVNMGFFFPRCTSVNMHVHICNMHVTDVNMHVDMQSTVRIGLALACPTPGGYNLLAQHNQIKLSQDLIVTKWARQLSDRFHSSVAHLDLLSCGQRFEKLNIRV